MANTSRPRVASTRTKYETRCSHESTHRSRHMDNAEKTLPRDQFTVRLRELSDNPGAVRSSSRVDIADFYGNAETWTIDTFRESTGDETAFVQRMSLTEPLRLMVPSKVMAALTRQRGSISKTTRKRGARQALATRIARGDTIGNVDALKRARKAKR